MHKHVAFLILLVPSIAIAAPSILSTSSDTTGHGKSLTIYGSDFGTKSNSAPLIWDDFETYSDDETLTSQGIWIQNGGEQATAAVTTADDHGGTKSARWTYNNTCNHDCFSIFYKDIGEQNELYATLWYKREGSDCGSIQKHFRFNNDTVYSGTPAYKVGGFDTSETAPNRPFLVNNDGVSGDGDVYSCGNQSWDAWHRMEVHGILSDPGGTANGTVDFAIDGTHSPGLPSNSKVTRATGITDNWNIFMLGTGLTYPTKTCHEYIDTVYLDEDQARVEICEGDTWSNRGMCEIQKWTSWSETSLNITVNQGGHSNGPAYFYAIDVNGDVSGSHQITFNSTSKPSVSSVNGIIIHGNSVTISGSGFGIKATAPPIKWETFEDGEDSALITSTSYWSQRGEGVTENPTIFSSLYQRHNNSTLNAHTLHQGNNDNKSAWFYKDDLPFTSTGYTYLNFWVRLDYVTGDDNWQLKLARINSNGNEHASNPAVKIESFLNTAIPNASYYLHPESTKSDGSDMGSADPGGAYGPREDHWINMAIAFKESSVDTADGGWFFWTSESPLTDGAYAATSSWPIVTQVSGYDDHIDNVSLGYLLVDGGHAAEAATWFDDVYIDNSWARLEIGDNATFENCTHREIQVPSTWSATQITATVNQGSFSDGDTAYLFVVNEDGTVSDGYPVTIGSGTSGANNTPTAQAQSVSVAENSTDNPITLSGYDADGDALTFTVTSDPVNGTLSGTAQDLYYTPNTDYSGSDSFSFIVNDDTVHSDEAVVTIDVQAQNSSSNNGGSSSGGCFAWTILQNRGE